MRTPASNRARKRAQPRAPRTSSIIQESEYSFSKKKILQTQKSFSLYRESHSSFRFANGRSVRYALSRRPNETHFVLRVFPASYRPLLPSPGGGGFLSLHKCCAGLAGTFLRPQTRWISGRSLATAVRP